MDKKYSIGLSTDITISEYDKLLNIYDDYIDYIYYSVPISDKFQSRKKLYKNFSIEKATDFLREVIDLFKSHHVKIELALNTYRITENDIALAYNYIEHSLKRMPDAIVSNHNMINSITAFFPDVYNIVSFNSYIKNESDLKRIPSCYNEIVLGSSSIRNCYFWKKVHDYNFKCRLLLNNGCSFNCGSCATANNCYNIFNQNLKKHSIDYLYALQSLYPSEVKKYISTNLYIDSYKISNRNCSFDYLIKCLDGYIYGDDKINDGIEHFYYWARLGHFGKYKYILNEKKVKYFKEIIWQNLPYTKMFTGAKKQK